MQELKHDDGNSGGRHQQEDEAGNYYKELVSKHKEKYSTPQYRLWARMQASGLHDNMDDPPNVAAFDSTPKRPRKDSLSNSLTDAAVAIVNTLSNTEKPKNDTVCKAVGVSPGKSIELRMKNYEQLRYLQQLYDDNIINECEFKEQKESILLSLRKLL